MRRIESGLSFQCHQFHISSPLPQLGELTSPQLCAFHETKHVADGAVHVAGLWQEATTVDKGRVDDASVLSAR
jgi:hypothetical protein